MGEGRGGGGVEIRIHVHDIHQHSTQRAAKHTRLTRIRHTELRTHSAGPGGQQCIALLYDTDRLRAGSKGPRAGMLAGADRHTKTRASLVVVAGRAAGTVVLGDGEAAPMVVLVDRVVVVGAGTACFGGARPFRTDPAAV